MTAGTSSSSGLGHDEDQWITLQSEKRARAGISAAAIVIIAIIVVAAGAGGYYVLSSRPASPSGTTQATLPSSSSSTSSSQSSSPTTTNVTGRASSTSTTSSAVASTSTTSSVLPGDVSSVYLHLAGADSAKDLFGNFSQIAFTLDIRSLNCSGSIDYTTSFSIVAHPVINGSRTTQVNGTDQVQSAGCMQGNPAALSQAYSILMAPNGTVIQVYRNNQAMGGSLLDDFGLATIIVSADGAYNFALTLLQNTTYFQEANSSSTTIGSAHLSVTSYAATPAFASLYLGSNLGSESVNIGTVQGATLYVPTYGIRTYRGTIDDSPSWLQTTLNLTSIATG